VIWRGFQGDTKMAGPVTLNQRVAGSSPATPTNKIKHLPTRHVPQE
jgi:hypothetical protein